MSAGMAIGPNFDEIHTSGTTTAGVGAKFNLGKEVSDVNGNVYRYVQADEAITAVANNPLAIAIDENNQAVILSGVLAITAVRIGWAPSVTPVIADTNFFWARMRGKFPIRVATGGVAADVLLGIITTGGRLTAAPTTVSAGNAVILGVVLAAAATNTASASTGNTVRDAVVTYPIGKAVDA